MSTPLKMATGAMSGDGSERFHANTGSQDLAVHSAGGGRSQCFAVARFALARGGANRDRCRGVGLQLAAFAVILALLIGIWWPRRALSVFPPLGVGMRLDLIALFGFYAANEPLYGFIGATFASLHTIVGVIAHLVLQQDQRGVDHFRHYPALLPSVVFQDRSSVFLSAAAILLFICCVTPPTWPAFKASRLAVTVAFVIPILMELVGGYTLYHTWMGLLIVGIAVVAGLELSPPFAGTPPGPPSRDRMQWAGARRRAAAAVGEGL